MFAFLAGVAAGLLHVFSGPDHLAAVAPLAADGRRSQWRTGLEWGIGHTTGVRADRPAVVVDSPAPSARCDLRLQRASGRLALIAVGAWGIRGAWMQRSQWCRRVRRTRMPAPRSPLERFTAWRAAPLVWYLAGARIFGAVRFDAVPRGLRPGAMAGMTAFAAGVGMIAIRCGSDHRRYRGLLYASSAAALVIGGFWLVGR